MESVKPSAVTPSKSKLVRTIAKVLHARTFTGIVPDDGIKKVKKTSQEKLRFDQEFTKNVDLSQSFDKLDEEFEKRVALKALLAKLFATTASIKAAYAQLQNAQSPYDADGIQVSDESIVSDLQALSELKRCFLKKQYDPAPEKTMALAEIQEMKSLLKTYEVTGKKLESQLKLKDSEIIFLHEKVEELGKQNRVIEKRLNQSGQLNIPDDVHISGLMPSHFITALRQTVKSVRSFVRSMVDEMKLANWDIDMAANSIEQGAVYYKLDHKCFAFEHFVVREMFDAFHLPNFSVSKEKKKLQRQIFFDRFVELKSIKAKDFLVTKPKSTFARFCRAKYLQLVHPKMESSFFGNLNQRNQITVGEFPDTEFFAMFAEMARRVWLLHCLAFSFEPEASIFQVPKGSRFSEVYMKSVTEEVFSAPDLKSDPRVSFMVVPGFRIGETIIQCEVYLSP